MVKAVKTKPVAKVVKKSSRTKVATTASLKKEFNVTLLELKKHFNKQLKEVRQAAVAKAIALAHELNAKHESAKSKAIKEAVNTIEKARQLKTKADKAQKKALITNSKAASPKKAKAVKKAKK